MSHLTSAIALKALDALYERAAVTAENIANANTPNYRPRRVSFEAALTQAAEKGLGAVRGVHPTIGFDTDPASASGVRMDLEVATETTTAIRYSALIEILNRQGQVDDLARSGNV